MQKKSFRLGKRELRAMAGLSMGSLQTSITGFCHPELFSALGLFSGFVTDIIQGTSLDMVERGKSNNEHLRILENEKRFAELFPVFFRSMGDQDPFWECFVRMINFWKKKGYIRSVKYIEAPMTGMFGEKAFWTLHRCCSRDVRKE